MPISNFYTILFDYIFTRNERRISKTKITVTLFFIILR